MSTYSKIYFRPAKGEQIETVIKLAQDERCAICGRVLDEKGKPVADALILLFRVQDGDKLQLISRFCTDEDGYFVFGPLDGEVLYLIKIFKGDIKLRELEIKTE
ncbi:MAG TPA: hypothetical protein GXZ52_01715 [Clostridiales bacterium]|jgi:5-hydroxyisourate hydrolase-like protein (transthyretin family)|nr:hypothetical protein [Clostridiales bacterium]